MKTFRNLLMMVVAVSFVAACSTPIEKDADRIKSAEDQLYAADDGFIDKEKAMELVDLYVDYSETYPQDSMAVEYLFKAAEFCLNLGEGLRAIGYYDRVLNEYPDFRKAPECLFLKAYIFENYLGDLENARRIYTEFIERYPDNEFADDAEVSIQNLGKTPEELIREFEAQQATTPDGE
jgi:TolA-binding protein